jgi:hypothetical protein
MFCGLFNYASSTRTTEIQMMGERYIGKNLEGSGALSHLPSFKVNSGDK